MADNPFAGTGLTAQVTSLEAVKQEMDSKASERESARAVVHSNEGQDNNQGDDDTYVEEDSAVEETTEGVKEEDDTTAKQDDIEEEDSAAEAGIDEDEDFNAEDFEDEDEAFPPKESLEKKEQQRQKQRAADDEASRDYTGFSPGEIDVFKQMSTHAFNTVRSSLLEAKEAGALKERLKELEKGGLPSSYYEHPEAYKLTPEYSKAQKALEDNNRLYSFYIEQLAAIKEGEPYQDFATGADGQLVRIQKEASSFGEIEIQQKLLSINNNISQAQNIINTAQSSYKENMQRSLGVLNNVHAQFFPSYAKEEEALKNEDYSYMDKALNERGLSHNPLKKFVSSMYAEIKKRDATINSLRQKFNGKTKAAAVAKQNGPSSRKFTKADKVSAEDKVFDVTKEFEDA